MVVTELAENIVKYGAEGQGVFAGAISIALESGVLRVSASNDVTSPQEAQTVKDVIAHIASSSDVKALYRSRLEELFRNPDLERAQLGLLRAAYEGGFRLSCQYSAPKLVVIAERRCGGR